MRIVAALGGNALLAPGERPDTDVEHHHIHRAAAALALLTRHHEVVVTHGIGPEVSWAPYPLDVLCAHSQGMVGYWLTQELVNVGVDRPIAALLTQTVVDADDPAFARPATFIGAGYDEASARELAGQRGWTVAADGHRWRRVVASPAPRSIVEITTIRLLVEAGVVVVCAGGGGAAVTRTDRGFTGAEAVVDKDLTAALLAEQLDADLLMLLTDVRGVIRDFGTPRARKLHSIDTARLGGMDFPAGSMGPKIDACRRFVERTGHRAAIGALADAAEIATGRAGTAIVAG